MNTTKIKNEKSWDQFLKRFATVYLSIMFIAIMEYPQDVLEGIIKSLF